MLPFAYKFPSSFASLVELSSAVPFTQYATQTHDNYCESLAAAAASAAAMNNRATVATNLNQRSTQLKKSFTIEAILGLDSTKSEEMPVRDDEFSYGRIKESDLRRRNHRPSPYSFPIVAGNKQMICDKDVKLRLDAESVVNGGKAMKSKRVRTIFTPEQLERLESEFERQQYMVGPERLFLASTLHLTEAQVKVWFQNRRIKWRKQHLEMQQARLAKLRNDDICEQRFDEIATSSDEENE